MASEVLVLIGSLGGAAIGVLGGVIGARITANTQLQTERLRCSMEFGFREWEQLMSYARGSGGAKVTSLVAFVHFHAELLRLIDADDLSAPAVAELFRKQSAINEALENLAPHNR